MKKKSLIKFKRSRRFLTNIWQTKKLTLKQKSKLKSLNKIKKKRSDFGFRLDTRQLISTLHGGIQKKRLKKLYKYAFKAKGNVSQNILTSLERRLDNILFRVNFCSSILRARQLINHKQICVNNSTVTSPSYELQPGDVLSINLCFMHTIKNEILSNYDNKRFLNHLPVNVEINYKTLTCIYVCSPSQIYYPILFHRDVLLKALKN